MFSLLKNIRQEVTELNAAICVAWSIILSRSNGLEITPDEVTSELIPIKESTYRQLRGKHSLHVPFPFFSQSQFLKMEKQHGVKIAYVRSLCGCVVYGPGFGRFPCVNRSYLCGASPKLDQRHAFLDLAHAPRDFSPTGTFCRAVFEVESAAGQSVADDSLAGRTDLHQRAD